MSSTRTSTFLDGVRVLDLSRILAGPLATQTLGDMGAEVLKIENPRGGDDTRSWGPPFQRDQSAYFQSCNRNKASLALDLKTPAGREQLLRLVAEADVCIDNFPLDLRQRLGVDAVTLSAHNPRLVVVNISTFAEASGREHERGYDLALQAESGWIALNGEAEHSGFKVGVAVLDVLTANMASNGALAALFARERTGRGQCVQVSLYQTALYSLVNVASNHLVSGQPTPRWGNAHPNIVPYQAFACRDRPIVIAVGNDRQFGELRQELGLPEGWAKLSNADRCRRRTEVVDAIADAVRPHAADEVIARLRARAVPCAPILRADEALARPEAKIVAVGHPAYGPVRTVASPLEAGGMRSTHRPPPALDEGGAEMAQRWLTAAAPSSDRADARPRPRPAPGPGHPTGSTEAPGSYHMTPDEFRRHGHAMVEFIASYRERVEQFPVQSTAKPGDVRSQLPPHAPRVGEPFAAILRDVENIILPGLTHWQSPSFFAYFPANASGPSVLGEMLSAGLGVQGMLWATSPACTELETHVLDWLIEMLDLPARLASSGPGGGVIQDSASSAVLCALLAACERQFSQHGASDPQARHQLRRRFVVYASQEAHSSVPKAVRIVGLGRDQLRLVDTDPEQRLDATRLAALVAADQQAGLVPLFVCATVGTTSTQAVDPIPAIAPITRASGMWLHVDAAMSGTAALCPEFRHLHAGVEYADSYTVNPHKWMFTNFDCCCMFVADRGPLLAALAILPQYLRNNATESGGVIDYRDWHIPLGRRFRALKLWFVIRHYGVEGLRHHIRHHVALARELRSWIEPDPQFELLGGRTLNLVCLRHIDGDAKTQHLLETVNRSGRAYLSHTVVDGRYVIRICVAQSHTTREHVRALWDQLRSTSASLPA
ncbi:MAG: hypothetical protein B7733_10000 [Myxococcales bacterium FL481]|nr:MAG: hypothetical protein B7733_10000 [Myxococcales bacterium FL481]